METPTISITQLPVITVITVGLVVFFILGYKLIFKRFLLNHKNLVFIAKVFYDHYYSMKGNPLQVNNYGYMPIDEDIFKYEPIGQCGVQLYNEVMKNKNSYLNIDNRTVVEVGCGRGGGEFLLDKFSPEKYIGIDFSQRAIKPTDKSIINIISQARRA